MASTVRDPGGRKRIMFQLQDRRAAVRLGRCNDEAAETVRVHVARLVTAKALNTSIPAQTVTWLDGLDSVIYRRLAAVGLVEPRAADQVVTLRAGIDKYLADAGVKPSTRRTIEQTTNALIEYFTESRDMATITSTDAKAWIARMGEDGLAKPTISRRVKQARTIFRRLRADKVITVENPFADIKAGKQSGDAHHEVTAEDAEKVMRASGCVQFATMVALSRWGGLRCPSEVLALRWDGVDWNKRSITVPSPKTAHIDGMAERDVPLYPELEDALRACYEQSPDRSGYVITEPRWRYHTNLSIALRHVITRAGLKVWPKPWHAMRATRQTELSEVFPVASVAAWQGNSVAVAMEHYVHPRDRHFAHAASVRTERGAPSGAQAAQNPTRQGGAGSRTTMKDCSEVTGEAGFTHDGALACASVHESSMTPEGFEPSLPP